jgi:hypothetical protein
VFLELGLLALVQDLVERLAQDGGAQGCRPPSRRASRECAAWEAASA